MEISADCSLCASTYEIQLRFWDRMMFVVCGREIKPFKKLRAQKIPCKSERMHCIMGTP